MSKSKPNLFSKSLKELLSFSGKNYPYIYLKKLKNGTLLGGTLFTDSPNSYSLFYNSYKVKDINFPDELTLDRKAALLLSKTKDVKITNASVLINGLEFPLDSFRVKKEAQHFTFYEEALMSYNQHISNFWEYYETLKRSPKGRPFTLDDSFLELLRNYRKNILSDRGSRQDVLDCVSIESDVFKLTARATDGYRASLYTQYFHKPQESYSKEPLKILLPSKLASKLDGFNKGRLDSKKNLISFKSHSGVIYIKNYPNLKYPSFSPVLSVYDKYPFSSFWFDVKELKQAVKTYIKVSALNDFSSHITIDFKNGVLYPNASNSLEATKSFYTLSKFLNKGEGPALNVNASYLLGVLELMGNSEFGFILRENHPYNNIALEPAPKWGEIPQRSNLKLFVMPSR